MPRDTPRYSQFFSPGISNEAIMRRTLHCAAFLSIAMFLRLASGAHAADDALPAATINGEGPDWKVLGLDDFNNVNCDPDTWSTADGTIRCTGQPVGVIRSKLPLTNWFLAMHLLTQAKNNVSALELKRHLGVASLVRPQRSIRRALSQQSDAGRPCADPTDGS